MNSPYTTFEFSSYYFDTTTYEAVFAYRFLSGEKVPLTFEEKILFATKDAAISTKDIPPEIIDNMMSALHILLGISYWKLYCPPNIIVATKPLTKDQAEFWTAVYTKGLGEFFYRNHIDFNGLINFPYEEKMVASVAAMPIERKNRSLIGIGGGKDSIVVGELLKKIDHEAAAYIMETQKSHDLSETVAEKMRLSRICFQRIIDPKLFQVNMLSGAYNGHIPVSAVFAFVGLFAALLHDYRYVIVGNERSANSENLIWNGMEINHQWSKSAEFEAMLQDYTKKYITPSVMYFSLLRPFSEIQIVQKFAEMPQYFHIFSSCNRNFKVYNETGLHGKLWCGECPKCAFVFALMSAYIPKNTLIDIFKKNLYADSSLVELFRELAGLTGKKPFECVGTFEETTVAMFMAYEKGEYKNDVVMNMFEREILPQIGAIEVLKGEVFANGDMSLVPEEFRKVIS